MIAHSNADQIRVLVITGDLLGPKMAGPAIRAWEMAKALHEVCEVRLVSTKASTLESNDFPVLFANEPELKQLVQWCEVLIFQGYTLSTFPWIRKTDTIIVADIYDPMHLEYLEQGKDQSIHKRAKMTDYISEVLNLQLEQADFFLCASEKQRDFWLGQLAAASRVNPLNYDRDPSLRSLIDIAAFGISNTPAVQNRHAIKGQVPGISLDDQVILWGGGIYNWFDPLTLIRAVSSLTATHPKIKLYFLGVKHPNPDVPAMRMTAQTMQLSDELGLTGTHVFFNADWVDYDDRVNFLLDADLGVSTHYDHVETAFSFRTRILDYLWAGLPIVSTAGDSFAELIQEHELGAVVPPEDADALADAIVKLLYSSERKNISTRVVEFGETMRWEQTLRSLLTFCMNPYRAADRSNLSSPIGKASKRAISRLRHTQVWKSTEGLRKYLKKITLRN